jgi:hypothetical protein
MLPTINPQAFRYCDVHDYVQSLGEVPCPKCSEGRLDQVARDAQNVETAKLASALSTQEGGDHYKKLGQYQPWEVLSHWLTPEELKGFAKGTVVAYLAREEDKGGRLDIKKAMHTLQIYLELTEENEQ